MSHINGKWDGDPKPYISPFFKYQISPSLDLNTKEIILSLSGKSDGDDTRELRMPFAGDTRITHITSFMENNSIRILFMQDKTSEMRGDIHIVINLSEEKDIEKKALKFLYMDVYFFLAHGDYSLVGSLKVPEHTGDIYPSTQFHWRAS